MLLLASSDLISIIMPRKKISSSSSLRKAAAKTQHSKREFILPLVVFLQRAGARIPTSTYFASKSL